MAKLGSRNFEVTGLDELQQTLTSIAPREANNLMKSVVHAVAGEARNKMRKRAPKDDGTLRKAIISKRRRGKPGFAVSDVWITHGQAATHDAWYWHFLEFGTTKQSAQPYIVPTIEEIRPEMPSIFREKFGAKYEQLMKRKAKKAAQQ